MLYLNNNTTISTGKMHVLLFSAAPDIFKFIVINGKTVQNTAGKRPIGIGGSSREPQTFSLQHQHLYYHWQPAID